MKLDIDISIMLNNLRCIKNIYKKNKEFFKTIGIDESTFSCWSSGRRNPRLTTLQRICKALDINLIDFLTKKIIIKPQIEFEKSDDESEPLE